MTEDQQAFINSVRTLQAKTLAKMRFDGLEVVLDESLPPRAEQMRVGREVWTEMQEFLPVVDEETAVADGW